MTLEAYMVCGRLSLIIRNSASLASYYEDTNRVGLLRQAVLAQPCYRVIFFAALDIFPHHPTINNGISVQTALSVFDIRHSPSAQSKLAWGLPRQ